MTYEVLIKNPTDREVTVKTVKAKGFRDALALVIYKADDFKFTRNTSDGGNVYETPSGWHAYIYKG